MVTWLLYGDLESLKGKPLKLLTSVCILSLLVMLLRAKLLTSGPVALRSGEFFYI